MINRLHAVLLVFIGLTGAASVVAQENPPLFGSWGFDGDALVVGIGERWRFNNGDAGNSFTNRNGRLEYESTQAGMRWLGWVSPSSSGNSFHKDWAAEVTVANESRPAAGFTYAGLDTYVLTDSSGSVGSSAYYGIYLRADATGRQLVAEWGLWNTTTGSFDRFSDSTPAPDSGAMRLRLLWRAGSRSLTVSASYNAEGFIPLKTFQLQGAEAALSHPWSEGMAIELSGVTNGGAAPVLAGQITFDDMFVYEPEVENPPLYGSANFSGSVLETGIGKRWRFNAGDAGNSLIQRDGRVEYTATQEGMRWLGWASPSSAHGNYGHNWTAEVTVTNDTFPSAGFTYAGMDTYVLADTAGVVGSNAYYGVYLRSTAQGRAIVADWGKWNSSSNQFDRFNEATALASSGAVRLQLSWDSAGKLLTVSYSTDGGQQYLPVKTYELAGQNAPPMPLGLNGMGIQLSGVNGGGAAPVLEGQITFDDVLVYGPALSAPLFGSDNFNHNALQVAVGQRWRFDAGNPGNSLTNRNGRLEYESSADGLRWLGWTSPSSAFDNYSYDWAAEVSVLNETNPAAGFIAAGLEAYLLSNALGAIGNNAYYGIYQSNFGGTRSLISEFGRHNPQTGNFDRHTDAYPLAGSGPVRLRLTWRSLAKELVLSYSTDTGASYTRLRSYHLDGEHAPFGPPSSNGFGLQLIGNNRSGEGVTAGQINHDNMAVYPPTVEPGSGFFGSDDFTDGATLNDRYTPVGTTNDASWLQTNGQLNFIADARSPAINNTNQAQQFVVWSDSPDGNTSAERNWSAEADFSIRREPVSINAAAFLGMEVIPAGNTETYYGIYITHATSGARVITIRGINGGTGFNRRVLGSTGTLNPDLTTENVRLRISYDAISKVLTSAFSMDGGLSWQDYSSFGSSNASGGSARDQIEVNWPVQPTSGFGLRLYGSLYGDGVNQGPQFAVGDATVRNLVVRSEPRTFQNWLNNHFTASQRMDPAVSARHADPNRDGIDNFHAYVFGIDPLAGGPAEALPLSRIIAADSGNSRFLTWSFQRAANPYLLLQVQASSDLNAWERIQPQISVAPLSTGLERISVQDLLPVNGISRRFLRFDFTDLL